VSSYSNNCRSAARSRTGLRKVCALGTRVFVDTPELCGHRGSGRGVVDGHAENTLASHLAAVAAGLRWVEVDARATVDGVLVARHDPVVEDGRFVADLTAAETDALGLMRLAELFAELPAHAGINVEIKTALEDALRPRAGTTAALVGELVGGEQGRRQILVSSFDPAAIGIVRERAPQVPIGLLTWGGFPLRKAIPAATHLEADVVAVQVSSFKLDQPPAERVERELLRSVEVAHEAGLQVIAWCPKPVQGDRLVEAGVDCLIVDDAAAAVAHYR
jgi:glycerophosphoryl diester phosphodiesterase